MLFPPEYGPLAAVTPGTPGGLMVMLAEYGTMSLAEVLEPSIQMADGYAIEASTANSMERNKELLKTWPYSRHVFLPHLGEEREAPYAGEIFRQPDLAVTLRKLVETEQQALAQGKTRKEAIYAAYDRFYKGDIAAGVREGIARTGRVAHHGGPGELAGLHRRTGQNHLQGHRGLQTHHLGTGAGDAAGAEHARERGPPVDGVQQRQVHPHSIPGNEPRFRRS